MFFAVSKPITCLSLQCFFLGPLCDGYWQERNVRQYFPSLCRCCGQINYHLLHLIFVTLKWPALDSISSASLSPDFDRRQISSWVVIVSWYSSTFTIWDKPRELPHVIFLISLKLHDSKFMLKLYYLLVPTSVCDEGQNRYFRPVWIDSEIKEANQLKIKRKLYNRRHWTMSCYLLSF